MNVKTKIREFEIRELKYKDMADMIDVSKDESTRKLMLKASDMTEEEYGELSLKDGIAVQKAINELNSLEDFQEPLKE